MNWLGGLLPFVLVIGLMWLMLVRPQQVRQRQHADLVSRVKPGDQVQLSSGLFGRVVRIDDERVVLETSPGVTSTWVKRAIATVVPEPDDRPRGESPTDYGDGSGTSA